MVPPCPRRAASDRRTSRASCATRQKFTSASVCNSRMRCPPSDRLMNGVGVAGTKSLSRTAPISELPRATKSDPRPSSNVRKSRRADGLPAIATGISVNRSLDGACSQKPWRLSGSPSRSPRTTRLASRGVQEQARSWLSTVPYIRLAHSRQDQPGDRPTASVSWATVSKVAENLVGVSSSSRSVARKDSSMKCRTAGTGGNSSPVSMPQGVLFVGAPRLKDLLRNGFVEQHLTHLPPPPQTPMPAEWHEPTLAGDARAHLHAGPILTGRPTSWPVTAPGRPDTMERSWSR